MTFKKSISAWELKSIIIKNKIVFYNYFKDYVFISLTANYENFIGEYLDYLKEYKNACHWLPQNQENNTYNMPDKYIVKDNKIKTTQQIKEEIRQRISVIRQGKAKEEVNNDNVIYLSQKTNNKVEDMPPAQFLGLLSLFMLFVIFIISCFVGMFL